MRKRFFLLAAIAALPAVGRAQLLPGPVVPAGPGLAVSGNALSVVYGTTAGTAAAGNDSRIVGALPAATAASTYLPIANPTVTGTLTAPALALTGSVAQSTVLVGPASGSGAPSQRVLGAVDIAGLSAATAAAAPVQSVAGRTGTVTISLGDVAGAGALAGLNAGMGLASGSGSLTVSYGTTAGTAAQGNDSRILGAVQQNGAASLASLAAVNTGFNIPIMGWDGSPQAAWGTTQGAGEYVVWRGGLAGNGAVLTTASTAGTGVNVNLNIAPQAGGTVNVGNGYGQLFVFQPPTTTTTGYWVATSIASPAGVYLAGGPSGSINAGIAPSGTGAFTLAVPDGTATGGNARGSNAVDLQTYRSGASQVATGSYAFQAGGGNTTGGPGTATFGFGQHANGAYGLDSGANGNDQYRTAMRLHSLGYFVTPGDDQLGETGLQGISTSGVGVRLTGDRAAAGNKNCLNVLAKDTIGLRFTLVGHDYTATGHHMAWINEGMLTTDGSLASAALLLATPRVLGDAATVSLTADTTNGCINATVTPGNSDTWHYLLRIDFTEVQ